MKRIYSIRKFCNEISTYVCFRKYISFSYARPPWSSETERNGKYKGVTYLICRSLIRCWLLEMRSVSSPCKSNKNKLLCFPSSERHSREILWRKSKANFDFTFDSRHVSIHYFIYFLSYWFSQVFRFALWSPFHNKNSRKICYASPSFVGKENYLKVFVIEFVDKLYTTYNAILSYYMKRDSLIETSTFVNIKQYSFLGQKLFRSRLLNIKLYITKLFLRKQSLASDRLERFLYKLCSVRLHALCSGSHSILFLMIYWKRKVQIYKTDNMVTTVVVLLSDLDLMSTGRDKLKCQQLWHGIDKLEVDIMGKETRKIAMLEP